MPMRSEGLYTKIQGQGPPLVILHGLFGTSDNWATLAKQFAESYTTILIDLRNHGRSFHRDTMSYEEMAEDILEFLDKEWIHQAWLLGHSMGGKVAMRLALDHPHRFSRLMVVDIAPKAYPGGHEQIFEALQSIDLRQLEDRTAAQHQLEQTIPDKGVIQFLLKNLHREKDGTFQWKMNLKVIVEAYPSILAGITATHPYAAPACFVRGGNSRYILDSDFEEIKTLFPASEVATIPQSGHWVHAEQPKLFSEAVYSFFTED